MRFYMKMSTKQLFFSWITVTIVMFGLSCIWHGTVLNDFSRMDYHEPSFFALILVIYMIIGVLVVKVVNIKFFKRTFERKYILKGVIKGMICGIVFYLLTAYFGFSFNTGSGIKNQVTDFIWQMIEQGVGGGVVGFIRMFTDRYREI